MSKEQTRQLMQQAIAGGDDVVIDISVHVVSLLRTLADNIESGKEQIGVAEVRMLQEHRPYSTYVVSVTNS